MTVPRENTLAFFPPSVTVGNVKLKALTLAGMVRLGELGVELGRRVPKARILDVAYVLWDGRETKTFKAFLRELKCKSLNDLSNGIETVLNDAFSTYVKPDIPPDKTIRTTPHGLGMPLEYAEFLVSEYGMRFCDAIETPVVRAFALYAAYRQRNGGKFSGFDYLERAYIQAMKSTGVKHG